MMRGIGMALPVLHRSLGWLLGSGRLSAGKGGSDTRNVERDYNKQCLEGVPVHLCSCWYLLGIVVGM